MQTNHFSKRMCFVVRIFPRFSACIRQSPAVGWMIHRTTTYLLLLFVYQWCWICCFCVILFVCYLWNYERQLDHKVEHRHGIYCKHFGNYCHFHPIILNQHLSSILIKYLIYALYIFFYFCTCHCLLCRLDHNAFNRFHINNINWILFNWALNRIDANSLI